MQEARFYIGSSLDEQPCYRNVNGVEVLTAQVAIIAGLVQIDDVASALVCLLLDGNPRLCRGVVHGRLRGPESPAYVNEVALHHFLTVLKVWMSAVDQRLIQHVTMRVGNGILCYLIKKWPTTGEYILVSTAAHGIVDELRRLCDGSKANVVMRPLSLPEGFDSQERVDLPIRLLVSAADHFRHALLAKGSSRRGRDPPMLPWATEELKGHLERSFQQDEQRALQHRAELGTVSAQILTRPMLTRDVAQEARGQLRAERGARRTLLDILSAAR